MNESELRIPDASPSTSLSLMAPLSDVVVSSESLRFTRLLRATAAVDTFRCATCRADLRRAAGEEA